MKNNKLLFYLFSMATLVGCTSRSMVPTLSDLSKHQTILKKEREDLYAVVELGREREYSSAAFEMDPKSKCYEGHPFLRGSLSKGSNGGLIKLCPHGASYDVEIFFVVNGVSEFLDIDSADVQFEIDKKNRLVYLKWDGHVYEAQPSSYPFPFSGFLIGKIKFVDESK